MKCNQNGQKSKCFCSLSVCIYHFMNNEAPIRQQIQNRWNPHTVPFLFLSMYFLICGPLSVPRHQLSGWSSSKLIVGVSTILIILVLTVNWVTTEWERRKFKYFKTRSRKKIVRTLIWGEGGILSLLVSRDYFIWKTHAQGAIYYYSHK